MIDQHTHTIYSPDASAEATLENYLQVCHQKKLTSVTFTDHLDYDCPTPIFHQIPDFLSFRRALLKAQEKTDTLLQMGVEIGFQPEVLKSMQKTVKDHPFDTVILSVHYVDRLDPYHGDFFENRTLTASYLRYFEEILTAIQSFADYQILAHLDYIFRYSLEKTDGIDLTPFFPVLDAIFETLIKQQKVLELNTSPYRKNYQNQAPHYGLMKRYYEKGGRLISLGSDAHHPHDVGADFPQATEVLKAIGFKEMTWVKAQTLTSVPFHL